jgi:ornithine cyclodeaminase/alanine dehydrogenase-like protein (mu-crystallin family)
MTLFLDDGDVCRLLSMEAAIATLDAAARSQADGSAPFTERANLILPNGWMRLAPAALVEVGVVGYKEFHSTAGVGVRFTINLFEYETGESLASIDGRRITAVRTGAAGGLAMRHCAAPDASVVAVLGSGSTARGQLDAAVAVRPVIGGKVYSPTGAHRARFCDEMSEQLDIELVPAASAPDAIEGADIVLVGTDTDGQPAVFGDWLHEGIHVSSIGSTLPDQRELDVSVWPVVDRVVVDTEGVLRDSGDALAALDAGVLVGTRMVELLDVVAGTVPGRRAPHEITLYKSVGTALQDVAVAYQVYLDAVREGLGQKWPDHVSVKTED